MDGIKLNLDSAKIIKLVSGEEICCMLPKEQLDDKSKLLRLEEPMLIKYVPRITNAGISDYIALVRWVGFTDDKIISIPKDKILTIANATKVFSDRYIKLRDVANSVNNKQKLPDYLDRDLKNNDSVEDYEDDFTEEELKQLEEYSKMPSKKFH